MKKLNQALVPSGVLVVSEVVVDEVRRDAKTLLGSLWLLGVSDEGNLYTQSEWLGFWGRRAFDLMPVSKESDWHIWFKASKRLSENLPDLVDLAGLEMGFRIGSKP